MTQKPESLNTRNSSGFTLIELLLVVAIITTVSILSGAFYSRFLLQSSVANTADQLTGSLRKAQIYSMSGKQGSGWGVNYSSNAITLYKGTTFSGRDASFDEKFSVNSNVTVNGLGEVYFYQMTGTPSSALTVTVSGNNNNQTITVNSQGGISR